jgi:CheY-like chemotaxis protein
MKYSFLRRSLNDRSVRESGISNLGGARMSGKYTVLVVDDEVGYIESVHDLLRLDCEVYGTTDPLEALRMLEVTAIHIVLADQRMPVMLGVDLLRHVREKHPETVRLLTCALYGADAIRAVCRLGKEEEGLFRYVNKGSPDDLKAAVQQAVSQYQSQAGCR